MELSKVADFYIKVSMMFGTVLVLLNLVSNQTLAAILSILFLIAIMVKGVSDVKIAKKQ